MMKKLFVIGMICLLLTGCNNKEENKDNKQEKSSYKTISAEKAHDMMNDDAVILDVRTEEEYKGTRIKGAINVPLDEIDENITSEVYELNSKDATILVYCASGNRSKQASSKLANLGYTNVYNFGGISDWTYEVVDGKIEDAENTIYSVMKAIELKYVNSIVDNEPFTLPFKVTCDGKDCIYDGGNIALSLETFPIGVFTIGTDGEFEDNRSLQMDGYQCSINRKIVTCK